MPRGTPDFGAYRTVEHFVKSFDVNEQAARLHSPLQAFRSGNVVLLDNYAFGYNPKQVSQFHNAYASLFIQSGLGSPAVLQLRAARGVENKVEYQYSTSFFYESLTSFLYVFSNFFHTQNIKFDVYMSDGNEIVMYSFKFHGMGPVLTVEGGTTINLGLLEFWNYAHGWNFFKVTIEPVERKIVSIFVNGKVFSQGLPHGKVFDPTPQFRIQSFITVEGTPNYEMDYRIALFAILINDYPSVL